MIISKEKARNKMQKCFLFLIVTLFTCNLFGSIEDHLRKINRSALDEANHKMRNIDFIYLINLDQRPEKLESCLKQFYPYQIFPYRFSAVNSWELPLEVINDVGVKFEPWMKSIKGSCFKYNEKNEIVCLHSNAIDEVGTTYFCHRANRGPIGITLSHLSILQDAYDSGYETIWVMEDDIEVMRDPTILPDVIERLDALVGKKNWDILFTDQDMKNNRTGEYVPCDSYAPRPDFEPQDPHRFQIRKDINAEFRKIGARYGAHSMIVRRSGMKKLLKHYREHQMFLPFDMEFLLPDMELYTVREDIVSNKQGSPSDNGGAKYKKKKPVPSSS